MISFHRERIWQSCEEGWAQKVKSDIQQVKALYPVYPVTPRWGGGGRGRVLSYKRLMGKCHWFGPHIHDCTDYNGVAFSIDIRMGLHIFRFLR